MVDRIRLVEPRTSDGRFARGNQLSRGNRGTAMRQKWRHGKTALHQLLRETDPKSPDKAPNWWSIWRRLLSSTLAGDVASARLLLAYALNLPRASLDVSGEFRDELPEMTMDMTLSEMNALYMRGLRAKRRPPPADESDILDLEPQREMTKQECTNYYLQSLEQAGRRIRHGE